MTDGRRPTYASAFASPFAKASGHEKASADEKATAARQECRRPWRFYNRRGTPPALGRDYAGQLGAPKAHVRRRGRLRYHDRARSIGFALSLDGLAGVLRQSRLGGTAGAVVVCRARTRGAPQAGGAPPFAKATGHEKASADEKATAARQECRRPWRFYNRRGAPPALGRDYGGQLGAPKAHVRRRGRLRYHDRAGKLASSLRL